MHELNMNLRFCNGKHSETFNVSPLQVYKIANDLSALQVSMLSLKMTDINKFL